MHKIAQYANFMIFRLNAKRENKLYKTRNARIYCDSISNSNRAIRFGEPTRSHRSLNPFFRLQEPLAGRFFFIYRCLPPKTHASHHYKIADYSRSRRGAFLPVRLDRLEQGIENGSERSRFRFKTEERGRRRRRRGPLIGGIRRPLRGWLERREGEGSRRETWRKNKAILSGTRVT